MLPWDPYREPWIDTAVSDRLRARSDEGFPYMVDSAELELLQSGSHGPGHPGWRPLPCTKTIEQAYSRLFAPGLDTDPEWEAARRRYQQAMMNPAMSLDAPIKMFNDIDILLFRGDLKRRVDLKWESFRAIKMEDGDRTLGFTLPPNTSHAPRLKIRLNADQDWPRLGGRRALVGTLAHEMLHAYFFIHCGVAGYKDLVTMPGMDTGHGHFFTKAARLMEAWTWLKIL